MVFMTNGAAFALMAMLYVYEGYQLAIYARTQAFQSLVLGVGAYAAGTAIMLFFLQVSAYGSVMVMTAMAIMVGEMLVSICIFREEYTDTQLLGLGFAMAAMFLVGLPELRS